MLNLWFLPLTKSIFSPHWDTHGAQARLYVDHQLAARGAVAIGGAEAGAISMAYDPLVNQQHDYHIVINHDFKRGLTINYGILMVFNGQLWDFNGI